MAMYGLTHSELFWEKKSDTKMLMAYNAHMVVCSFRGTASLSNALSDLRVSHGASPAAVTPHILQQPPAHPSSQRDTRSLLASLRSSRADAAEHASRLQSTRDGAQPADLTGGLLQAWPVLHHPPRGRMGLGRPRVHQGFQACWRCNGFHQQVLPAALNCISQQQPLSACRPAP